VKLYVMRHGVAEADAASGRDFDRALTAVGRDRVRATAKVLLDDGEAPHAVITSPLVRAVQTAEIVAIATKLSDRGGTVETSRELAPGGAQTRLVAELVKSGRKRVMIVGHEPDLSTLVGEVLRHPMPVPMDKGMVVGLQVEDGSAAKLRFILNPKTLAWLFDGRKSAKST
jgi:phosphohistidine phosphatase